MQNYSKLTINLSRVRENLDAIETSLPERCKIMPMVKASAYGTDSVEMARFFQNSQVPYVGVSMVKEGVLLRQNGITLPIFVICAPPFEADLIVQYDLEPAVSNEAEAKALNENAAVYGKEISVHFNIDTGLNRFGCRPCECQQMISLISDLPFLKLKGVMTHLKGAEDKSADIQTHAQLELFHCILNEFPVRPQWIHVANSAGALRWEIASCNLVRIGLAIYGIYSSEAEISKVKLKPALELTTRISAVRECHYGDTIGYGFSSMVQKEKAKIAVLAIGYHDGLHGHYSEKGYTLIHGKKAPMVGKICMDYMMVDITDIPEAKVGDQVEIFGNSIPVEEVAKWGDTNVRELICCLGPRVQRIFKHPAQKFTSEDTSLFENLVLH